LRLRPSARVARASTCSAGAASTGCSPARTASPGLSRRAAATARRHVRGSTEAGRRAVSARRATSQRRRARARRGQSAARLGEVRLRGAQRGVAEVERRRVHQQRHHARKVLHHVPVEHLRADWRCSGAAGCARKCSLPCTRQAPAGRRQVGAAAGCHGCSGRSGCCQGTRAPLRRSDPLPGPQARAGRALVSDAHSAVIARPGGPAVSARAAPRGRRPGRRGGRRARRRGVALEGTEARVAQQALQMAVQDHLLGRARGRVVERHILRVDHQPLRARAPARRRAGHAAGFSLGMGRWPGLAREGSRVQDSPQCAGNFKRRHEADGCGIQQSHEVNLCARTPVSIAGQGHGRALDAGARLVRIAEGAGKRGLLRGHQRKRRRQRAQRQRAAAAGPTGVRRAGTRPGRCGASGWVLQLTSFQNASSMLIERGRHCHMQPRHSGHSR